MRAAGAHRKKRKEHLCDARALSQPASKSQSETRLKKKKQSVVCACACACARVRRDQTNNVSCCGMGTGPLFGPPMLALTCGDYKSSEKHLCYSIEFDVYELLFLPGVLPSSLFTDDAVFGLLFAVLCFIGNSI